MAVIVYPVAIIVRFVADMIYLVAIILIFVAVIVLARCPYSAASQDTHMMNSAC